jgi:hypothetical protein
MKTKHFFVGVLEDENINESFSVGFGRSGVVVTILAYVALTSSLSFHLYTWCDNGFASFSFVKSFKVIMGLYLFLKEGRCSKSFNFMPIQLTHRDNWSSAGTWNSFVTIVCKLGVTAGPRSWNSFTI